MRALTMLTKNCQFSIENPALNSLYEDTDILSHLKKDKNDTLESYLDWETNFRESENKDSLSVYISLQYNYCKEGQVLYNIWEEFLWKQEKKYRDFNNFCKDVLHKPFWLVKNIINASAVASNLINLGFNELPTSISVCAVLRLLKADTYEEYDERLVNIWKQVLKLHPIKRTAKNVKQIIKLTYPELMPIPHKRKLLLETELVEKLETEAVKEEVTVSNYINNMFVKIEDLEYELNDLKYELKNKSKLPQRKPVTHNELVSETLFFDEFVRQCQKLSIDYLTILKKLTIPKIISQLYELIT